MEYVTGSTLARTIKSGPILEETAISVGIQIASELENAAEMGIPEVFAQKLREHLVATNGYLFATAKGRLLQQRNVLRILQRVKPVGFHAFRRFRLTWLRKNGVPKDLERYWMGHAPEEVGDLYSKLKDDVSFRQEWAERAGLGFELVHVGPQNAGAVSTKRVA
jgi:integrase